MNANPDAATSVPNQTSYFHNGAFFHVTPRLYMSVTSNFAYFRPLLIRPTERFPARTKRPIIFSRFRRPDVTILTKTRLGSLCVRRSHVVYPTPISIKVCRLDSRIHLSPFSNTFGGLELTVDVVHSDCTKRKFMNAALQRAVLISILPNLHQPRPLHRHFHPLCPLPCPFLLVRRLSSVIAPGYE